MNADLALAQEVLAENMEERANRRKVNGVGVVVLINPWDRTSQLNITTVFVGTGIQNPEFNPFAYATAKIGQMIRTWRNSGQPPLDGENEYRGGIATKIGQGGIWALLAFSGGSEDEDMDIVKYAVLAYPTKYLEAQLQQSHGTAFILTLLG